MATDVTAGFGPGLLQSIGNPRMNFQACPLSFPSAVTQYPALRNGSPKRATHVL